MEKAAIQPVYGSYEENVRVFRETRPDFFTLPGIKVLPPDKIFDEMFLDLHAFRAEDHVIPLPEGVSFGFYEGPKDKLLEAVGQVGKHWVEIYRKTDRAYCAYWKGEVASFCTFVDCGAHTYLGKDARFVAPGCVGTVPAFRRNGIGLAMMRNVTAIAAEEGFDYSYIHYTGVAHWYARLGYTIVLRWTKDGLLPESALQ